MSKTEGFAGLVAVREIVDKLKHGIYEIRSRALQTLRFKLQHGILTVSDLVQETPLLAALLEWFNQNAVDGSGGTAASVSPATLFEDNSYALSLLLDLARSPSGRHNLVELGAIRFLRQVRADIAPVLQAQIDEVVKALLFQGAEIVTGESGSTYEPGSTGKHVGVLSASDKAPQRSRQSTSVNAPADHPSATRARSPLAGTRRRDTYATLKTPPRVPNSIRIPFETVHLSRIDEKFVADFQHVLAASVERLDLYAKVHWGFDVLCRDYQAQIFLQRPRMLMILLNGLHAHEEHAYFTLDLVDKLVDGWTMSFRHAVGTFRAAGSATFVNNSPDATFTASLGVETPGVDVAAVDSEETISLPFACHELFTRVAPLLKKPAMVRAVCKIIVRLLPFLKLYLDSLVGSSEGDEFTAQEDYTKHSIFYLSTIVEVAIYYQVDVETDGFYRDMIQRLLFGLIVDYVGTFVPDEEDPSLSPTFFSCVDFALKAFPLQMAKALCGNGFQAGHFQFVIHLLRHDLVEIRLEAVKELLANGGMANKDIDMEVLYVLLTETLADRDAEVRETAYSVVSNALLCLKDTSKFPAIYALLQVHYEMDTGLLLARLLTKHHHAIDQSHMLEFSLRAMLSRAERYRRDSVSVIAGSLRKAGLMPVRAMDGAAWTCFEFDSQQLASIVSDYRAGGATTVDDISVEEMLRNLLNANPDVARNYLHQLWLLAKEPDTAAECVDNQIIPVIFSFLSKMAQLNANESAIHFDKHICLALSILRTLLETVDAVSIGPMLTENNLLTLAAFSIMDSVQVRYETARLLLRILLPLDVARGIGFRSEANLGKDEIVKAVVDENMEIPLTVGNTSKQLRLCLPNIILETFSVYGPVDRVLAIKPATVTLSIEEAQSIKKCLEDNRAIVGQDISFTSLLDAVKTSRSHVQFLSHLEGLYWFLASLNVVGRDDLQTVVEVLKKFLLVPPANFQDAQVLERVVKFVTMLIAATPDANEEHADILWPVVVEAMNANVLPLLMGDHTMDLPTKSTAGDTFNLGDIQNAHLGFVCTLAQKLPCSHVTRLLRETPVMDVIKTVTVKCFSSPQVTVQDRENRIRCLRVILQLVSMPSLVDVVDGQTIGDFIAVLTQTLGCLQQNFANIDTFSHQDRTVYRLLALSLRHISRTASELALAPAGGKNKIRANWIWGDHWLFEGALDWLLTLLSDDDIRMQRIALGIIGNFLLVPESYRSIMAKIPNFLDMAFAYALDVEQDEGMRKESLMVINNFFIRFCHDNNIASAADVAAAVAQGDDKRKEIGRVLDLFENCLFFDRLGDVLDHRYFLLGQPVALMELMRNVALVFPEYLRRKCMEHNLWSHLMRLLITRADVDRLLDDERPTVNCVMSFERLRRRHFREVHGHAIGLAQDFFLMVVRTLARDDDATRKYIVLHTSFPRRIVQALSDSINWWFQAPCYRSLQRQLLLHLCATFADMLADTYVHARSVLAQGLSIEFLSSLLRVSNELLQEDKRTLVELQPVVFLLGKLFALTSYIDAVGVTLQQLLSAEDIHGASLVDGIFALYECWCDGRKFTKSELAFGIGAMTLLTDMLLLSPAVVIGATAFARLARFLLEELEHRFKHTSTFVVTEELAMLQLLLQIQLHAPLAKKDLAKLHQHLLLSIASVVSSKDANQGLGISFVQEVLSIVEQLYKNSGEARRLSAGSLFELADSSRRSGSSMKTCNNGPWMLDVLKCLLMEKTDKRLGNMLVFQRALAALCECIVSDDARSYFLKTHALHELQTECFPRLLKNREHTKMELLLHFYMRLSTFPDTHPYIVRVPGMLDDLIDMLDTGRKSKSAPGNAIAAPSSLTMLALLTIRNVAFAKETKAFFLNDENFIGTLFRVLEQPNAGEEVLAAATACLWVLLYDNQKAKATLGAERLASALDVLEGRLTKKATESSTYYDETMRNLSMIRGCLV